jgi:hypothetical protein
MSVAADIKNATIGIVKDDSGKLAVQDETGSDSYDRCINAAVLEFSRARPDQPTVDYTGNSGHDYALPSRWTDQFSSIQAIEFPTGKIPESYLDADEFYLYNTPSGTLIRLAYETPSDVQAFRVTYTILRTTSTIPDGDVAAFCYLAASLCLESLANMFAQTSDPTIAADSVNYRTKSYEFTKRAKQLRDIYKEHMGIKDDDTTVAASASTELKIGYPGGVDRLTHPRRMRDRR